MKTPEQHIEKEDLMVFHLQKKLEKLQRRIDGHKEKSNTIKGQVRIEALKSSKVTNDIFGKNKNKELKKNDGPGK